MANPQPQPETPHDPEAEAFAAAVRDGIAAADAGRTLPYGDVRRWVLSWGTPGELSRPRRG